MEVIHKVILYRLLMEIFMVWQMVVEQTDKEPFLRSLQPVLLLCCEACPEPMALIPLEVWYRELTANYMDYAQTAVLIATELFLVLPQLEHLQKYFHLFLLRTEVI